LSVFIELTTDAFADTFDNFNDIQKTNRRAGLDRARRPLRGLEIKDDTYAFLKIVRSDGTEIKLIDSSSPDGQDSNYSNFILQSVSEARMEKHQIVDTFGEPYIYFFGESPRFLDVTAVLIDSLDFNWYAEFWENYNKFFRGTRSVELGARTYLFYDDNIVEGYVLNAQAQKMAEQPMQARLSFRMYLTNYSNISFVGDPKFPIRASVNLPPNVNLTTADAFTVGEAALQSVTDATLKEARQLDFQVGYGQQVAGFGGGGKLAEALRGGLSETGNPLTDPLVRNVLTAIGNAGSRTLPLRGLIADNFDEYTALAPDSPESGEGDRGTDEPGSPEAKDLTTKATTILGTHGVDINDPAIMKQLGLGPYFGNSCRASFSISGSDLFDAAKGLAGAVKRGGIGGGLGFIAGGATKGINDVRKSIRNQVKDVGTSIRDKKRALEKKVDRFGDALSDGDLAAAGKEVFGNGVSINKGVTQGTGVGGGIPGGVSGGVGPKGPGTLKQFTGGTSYAEPDPCGAHGAYNQGAPANGAGISIGGKPSAFSTVAAPGTLNTGGTITETFNIGPNGVSSKENKTGIFA
jgi:hypothetical protein